MSYEAKQVMPGAFEIYGPGISRYSGPTLLLESQDQADAVCRLLAKAHRAGRDAKAGEIRSALGVYEPIVCR